MDTDQLAKLTAEMNAIEEKLRELGVPDLTLWQSFSKRTRRGLILSAASMAAGIALAAGTTGWLLAEKRLKTKYEELAEVEIAEAREFYNRVNKGEGYETPEDAVKSLHGDSLVVEAADALRLYQGNSDKSEPEETNEYVVEETQTVNIFAEKHEGSSDLTDEDMNNRTPTYPYLINHEEFLQGESGYEQVTLTYYEGDDVLVDEKDEPIPDVNPIIGDDNLTRFGAGSDDARTVYIRNERLSLDFEVVKSDGKFAHEVLGLQHSDTRMQSRREIRSAVHRFRGADE